MLDNDGVLARISRLESYEGIRALAAKYATFADARDFVGLAGLYVDDVQVGQERGRAALVGRCERLFRDMGYGRTIHSTCNHVITLSPNDESHAHGTVYCRAEHEMNGLWVVGMVQYWDDYERRDGVWYFARRAAKTWYVADVLERPGDPEWIAHQLTPSRRAPTADLPWAWPTWTEFENRTHLSDPVGGGD
jgi:SnoaL-like domain